MNWQPIETAPKDGALILFWDELSGYEVGYWGECKDYLADDDDSVIIGWTDGMNPIVGDGENFQPSYWMPLPPPPQENTHG